MKVPDGWTGHHIHEALNAWVQNDRVVDTNQDRLGVEDLPPDWHWVVCVLPRVHVVKAGCYGYGAVSNVTTRRNHEPRLRLLVTAPTLGHVMEFYLALRDKTLAEQFLLGYYGLSDETEAAEALMVSLGGRPTFLSAALYREVEPTPQG